MVLPVLGMTFLQPKPTFAAASTNGDERSPRFEGREGEKRAHAVEADDEFVVLADSPARREGHQNWTTYRGQRDGLVESGKLIPSDDPQYYVFADHVGFASPSAAAAVIAAGNRNGRTYWKVEGTGQTYGMAGGEAAGSGGGEWGGRRRVKT